MISSVNAEDYNLLNTQTHPQADKPTVFQVAWPYVVTTVLATTALLFVAIKITDFTLPIIFLIGMAAEMACMSFLLGLYVKNSDEFKKLIHPTLGVACLIGLLEGTWIEFFSTDA